jgi:hypothetical protein
MRVGEAPVHLVPEEQPDDAHREAADGGLGEVEVPYARLVAVQLFQGQGGEEGWVCEAERVRLV